MVAQMNELNLFSNNPDFEQYDKMIKDANKNKRGHYQKHHKSIIYNPYTEIKDLYRQLANFLPQPLFSDREEVFHLSGITGWYTVYDWEEYEYDNAMFEGEEKGTFEGEYFKIVEAEIEGTENFCVEDRIALHKELINYLEKGIPLNEAMAMLQPYINIISKKYKIKELTQWLRKQHQNIE